MSFPVIAVANSQGQFIKSLPALTEQIFGLHSLLGFISESAFHQRIKSRKLQGLKSGGSWGFKFRVIPDSGGLQIQAVSGCEARLTGDSWVIESASGTFQLLQSEAVAWVGDRLGKEIPAEKNDSLKFSFLLFVMAFLGVFLAPSPQREEIKTPEIEPITVKMKREVIRQKAVAVPTHGLPKVTQAHRAVEQNLGFLKLLGRKDLKKVIGGAPTALTDASPGAGAGGKGGSGGELLVGLGQGVKRASIGNTGVAGLGGVGTKGAGGGAGGYGNSLVGSGEGRALSAMASSKDIVLEGGLDRSVIQATIAKYISQVRACYEQGLSQNPGLNGQVSMAFQIAPSGGLDFARVAKSTLGHQGVESCISQRMLTWKFPKPLGGVAVKVNYPFLLRPVGS